MDLKTYITLSLKEDIQTGDITSLACIPKASRSSAKLLVKEDGILAGVEFAEMVFKQVDPEMIFTCHIKDGTYVKYGDIAFEVEGSTRDLLKTERLVLNVMQRMSGIATLSSRFATEVEGFPVKIIDTRKTTALNRHVEKWAVRIGGCENYRIGLYDWFMIKDNHIKACGSITKAIKVEVADVLRGGSVDRIMLDNFDIILMREAVEMIGDRFEIEASGGVSLETVRKIAQTGVNYISVGALTHSAGSLDLSLKIQ